MGSTVSAKNSIMELDQTLTHHAQVDGRRGLPKMAETACTADDAILVASKKTNVTVLEI